MTDRFKSGDHVRVRRTHGSPWQDMHGTIVEIIAHHGIEPVQECAVNFSGDLRWFMAEHLTRTVAPRLLRVFRNEVSERWKLDAVHTTFLNGDRDQLIDFLRDHHDFAIRRAEAEVDEFYSAFEAKILQAIDAMPRQPKTGRAKSDTAA